YTHRVAISNQRLVGADDGGVAFRWKDYLLHRAHPRGEQAGPTPQSLARVSASSYAWPQSSNSPWKKQPPMISANCPALARAAAGVWSFYNTLPTGWRPPPCPR